MIEGRSNHDFPAIIKMMNEAPALLHQLLGVLAASVCAHLNAQIEAGVQAVMIFDTWGGMLSYENYQHFSLSYIKQIMKGLIREQDDQKIPVILFTKKGGPFLPLLAESTCDVVGVDALVSLKDARHLTKDKVALQGNMDPFCLMQAPDVIRDEVSKILASFGHGEGHVFNLGHGINKETDPSHVAVLIDAVHELSQTYHKERG
jgi:uroporphyrinogen decarboxylase